MTSTQTASTQVAARRAGGATVWLTGLPSAGKTTLALALADELRARGADVEILDGDQVRTHLSAGLGFTRQDRETQVTRIGFVAELLARHGVIVLVPVIAPYADAREGPDPSRCHRQHPAAGPSLHAGGGLRRTRCEGPVRQGLSG